MLFLAKVKVKKDHYMGGTENYTTWHLVDAFDENSAERKVEDFYKVKEISYGISYWVDVEIMETIH